MQMELQALASKLEELNRQGAKLAKKKTQDGSR